MHSQDLNEAPALNELFREDYLLDSDEELALIERAKLGDKEAATRLHASLIRIVHRMANQCHARFPRIPVTTLRTEGYHAVQRAIMHFDRSKGQRLYPYAVTHIRWTFREQTRLLGYGVVCPKRNTLRRLAEIREAQRELAADFDDAVPDTAIAEAINDRLAKAEVECGTAENPVTPRQVAHLRDTFFRSCLSLDAPLGDDAEDGPVFGECIPDDWVTTPDRVAEANDNACVVASLLEGLNDRAKRVIELRYGLTGPALTLEQIGAMLNLTKERIRQIEFDATRRLRFLARSLKGQVSFIA